MARYHVSLILLIVSFVLLLIFSLNELSEKEHSENGEELEEKHMQEKEHSELEERGELEKHEEVEERRGFLPFGEIVNGILFGWIGVFLSIIAFAVSRNYVPKYISAILIINGALIIVTLTGLAISGRIESELSEGKTGEIVAIGGVLLAGAIVTIIIGIKPLVHKINS